MAGEWITSRLRDEADLLTGFPFKSEGYTDATDGVRLLRGDNIVQAALRWDGVKRWPRNSAQEFSNYALAAGDVVLAMDRPWIEAGLKFAAISPADLPCLLVQRTARIRGGNKLDIGFLRYLIGSREFTQHVLAVQTGTTVPHISARQILDFEFLLPPLSEQKRIAHILGTLDDKIELNRRMNATLEGISRAVFKSWFVDFDPVRQKAAGKQPVGMDAQTAALFPDSFEDSEIGEVPKGWETGPLSRFFAIGLGGAWGDEGPSAKSSQAVRCLRGIDCHDLAEGLLPEVPSRWISPKQCNDRLLTDGTILVEGSGSFCGRSLCWRPEYESLVAPPVVYSNFCKRLSPQCSPSQAHIVWCQMRAAYASGEFAAFRIGTAFPNFDMQGALENFRVVVPPDSLARRFAEIARQSQRLDLTRQSRTLATLRDTLLPKLLSGEVRVPEAEEAVEEAVR